MKDYEPRIVIPAGGKGCISIEDGLLNLTPNVISVTGVHDSGGHSGLLRIEEGVLPPGDATHRIGIHIRDKEGDVGKLAGFRWNGNSSLKGHRPLTELLAAAEIITGSHSGGVKLLEKAFAAHYVGRVIPISDDNVHIRARMEDGSYLEGETNIDTREINTPAITDIEFIPQPPRANPEVLEIINGLTPKDAILIPPSDLWTSLVPILKTPGLAEAIRQSRSPLLWFCNASTKFAETNGYTARKFAHVIVGILGRPIDHAFVNEPDHDFPPTYARIGSYPVINDLAGCSLANKIHRGNFTRIEIEQGQAHQLKVVRHNSEVCAQAILDVLTPKVFAS
ncbi:MAG: YvcK family protein [Candidatus Daviesbacteria bacterium]|nr:MAG: YvcK family protein [Candidatus Daviesbacteria bacterium]